VRRRVLLHVGPPKTGTTYLQRVLRRNATALASAGWRVLVDQKVLRAAASELVGAAPHPDGEVPHDAWQRVRERIAGPGDHVVVSCERFSLLGTEEVDRLRRDLARDADDSSLHAVVGLRDVAALLPSRWQEQIKNGGTQRWSDFCRRVASDPEFVARITRMRRTLSAWSEVLGAENVRVVTTPPAGTSREVLATRFARAAGLPTGILSAPEPAAVNRSMGVTGSELVRRLNLRATELPRGVRRTELKSFLAATLAQRPDTRLALTPPAFAAARAESVRLAEQVRAGGHELAGDLADLDWVPRPADDLPVVEEAQVRDAALDALAALAVRSHEARRTAARATRAAEVERRTRRSGWRRRRPRS
jgi:hypothetical protein